MLHGRESRMRTRLAGVAVAGSAVLLLVFFGLRCSLGESAAPPTPVAMEVARVPAAPPALTLANLGVRLAYARVDRSGAGTLVIHNPDDSTIDVREAHGVFTGIAWAPDGSHVAASFGPSPDVQDIYLVNADGTNLKRLTAGGQARQPTWSPDGLTIAFVAGPVAGPGTVSTTRADGGGSKPLAQAPGQQDPAWAPDGSVIAASGEPGTIVLLAPATGAQTGAVQLLRDSAPSVTSISWAPDSTAVAAVVLRGANLAVVVLADNLTTQRQVGAAILGHPDDPAWPHPSFALGGSKVIAASAASGEILVFDINALPTDSLSGPTAGAVQVLVPAPTGDRLAYPAVSPIDGNRSSAIT